MSELAIMFATICKVSISSGVHSRSVLQASKQIRPQYFPPTANGSTRIDEIPSFSKSVFAGPAFMVRGKPETDFKSRSGANQGSASIPHWRAFRKKSASGFAGALGACQPHLKK